ncbi:MAG: hypothetical protein CVU24_09690 [Betaproteobacteria bacterium HGW-Betaproteobacteria-18]|nr:MAG: hypothetical protein CVU24_09690 [Betaproteobacteria bacterium HGW-Betaproteobacteria-18]
MTPRCDADGVLSVLVWNFLKGRHESPSQTLLDVAGYGRGLAACGKVTVANMHRQSAKVLAHIDKLILSSGYGCEVELVPGDTMPTFTAMMEKGKPDVAATS